MKGDAPIIRADKKDKGAFGEDVALEFLLKKGFCLKERNFRCKQGEIDLIMEDGNYLVFVEVKLRVGARFGTPLEAISPVKQKKIHQVAAYYMQKNKIYQQDLRFDAIGISGQNGETIEHIVNAF